MIDTWREKIVYGTLENLITAYAKGAYTRRQLMHDVIAALASTPVVPYAAASDAFADS